MDELIDIWNEEGEPTGRIALKSEAHKNGWFHPTVHIWLYTRKGEILLQRRSKHKDTFPDMWDVSVAGHIGAGEDLKNGAIREIQEEIGLGINPEDLTFSGVFKAIHQHPGDLLDCEFHHIYFAELKCDLSALMLQKTEVAELRLVHFSILETGVCTWNPIEKIVPHGADYYQSVINALGLLL